jgi:hypothetical protein
MQPVSPALLELAQRLRQLREQHWPEARLTQGALANALGGNEQLAAATVSSWEKSHDTQASSATSAACLCPILRHSQVGPARTGPPDGRAG